MKKKILLLTHPLILTTAGGAERVFIDMANKLTAEGYEVVAACYSETTGKPFYPLDEKVKFINFYYEQFDETLNKFHNRSLIEEFLCKYFIFPEDFQKFKQHSDKFEQLLEREKPDLLICHFIATYREVSYCKKFNIPAIIMFHSEPSRFFTFFGKKYFKLNRLALNKADAVQVLLPSYVDTIKKYYSGKISVIGNAVEPVYAEKNAKLSENKEKYIILCISRFDKFKRQDILTEAFSLIAHKYPEWEVHFYGQFQPPKQYDFINGLIEKHNLQNQVKCLGVTENPPEKYENADIFVLPSEFEGFPLSLTEAMSVGLPCLGFADCSGVNELINHNENGFLAEKTPEDIAKYLEILINDRDLRINLGKTAKESVKEFSPEIIWNKWNKLIQDTLNKKTKDIKWTEYLKLLF